MDGRRFDTLTRALAASDGATHRRGFLKAVAAGLTVAALGRATTETAGAVCPPGQVSRRRVGCVCQTTGRPPVEGACPCLPGKIACDGVCIAAECCDASQCAAGQLCQDNSCIDPPVACPDGTTPDFATDPLNCGGCGNRCRASETCGGGVCRCGDEICGAEFSCDPIGSGRCACTEPRRGFFDPVQGETNRDCPAPKTTCIGPMCSVCCPVGTGCDLATGTCFQLP